MLWGIALFYLGCFAVFAVLCWLAPEGHETPAGFRYGPPAAALAHCERCDLWLRPDQACLHIAAVVAADATAAPALGRSLSLHSTPNSSGGPQNRV